MQDFRYSSQDLWR